MSRGRRISDSVNKLIIQESLNNPDMPRRVLAVKLQDYISRMGEPTPTEETLVKMISKVRTETPDPLDRPWSLKASIENSFPIQSTPQLLRAWKTCLALGIPFTIRQARWAAHLSTVTNSTMDLVTWSHHYATLERVYKLVGEPFTGIDLDISLTASIFEICSLAILGKMQPIPIPGGGIILRSTPVSFSQDAIEASKEAEYAALAELRLSSSSYDEALRQSDDDRNVLPSIEESNFPQELVWIYCHWLTCFKKAPKWRDLQRSEAIDIIKELRQWLSTLPETISRISKNITNLMVVQKKDVNLEQIVYHTELLPPELLLDKLGYLSDDSTTSILSDWTSLIERIATLESKADNYIKTHKTDVRRRAK